MTWGGPPPAFSATAPMEKPTTGPPGVAAPAMTAVRTPGQPESGPSQPVMISWGMMAAIYPEPITPSAMRGTILMKSMAPSRSDVVRTSRPRCRAIYPTAATRAPQDDVDDKGGAHGGPSFGYIRT